MTEIEVFRAGRASRGITADNLAEVAGFDCAANPIGICFGHPKNDDPAAGTIEGFRAEGDTLFAKIGNLAQDAIDGIKTGKWLNRSMAFFHPEDEANPTPGKWAPRHLGLLGASAPGIPGMKNLKQALAFDATGGLIATDKPAPAAWEQPEGTAALPITFSKEDDTMADALTAEQIAENDRLAKAKTDQDERERTFAAKVRTSFEAGNAAIVAGLVTAGKVLPAEVDNLKLVFNAFDPEGAELTFGAGDKATKNTAAGALAAFLDGALDKRVPLGKRESPSREFSGSDTLTAGDITAQATKRASDKGITFDAAVAEIHDEAATQE